MKYMRNDKLGYGRSGCLVQLIEGPEKTIVRKTSSGSRYNTRLLDQESKQQLFNNQFPQRENVFAPQIHNRGYDKNNRFYFEMEYINGLSYVDYFLRNPIDDAMSSFRILISFIRSEINQSTESHCPRDLVFRKIEELELLLKERSHVKMNKVISSLKKKLPSTKIPRGFCHGDLTFANTIFAENGICLIDFLDSFVESPLLDIVKLRQDTKLFWSLYLEDLENHEFIKLRELFTAFDSLLCAEFQRMKYFRDWYGIFETINLLRILPYLKDQKEIGFIYKALGAN